MRNRCACHSLLIICAVAVLPLGGCHRDKNTVILKPPFDDHAKVAEVTATWEQSRDERAFADGRKLDAPQVRVQYRVDVRNKLDDKLFVRLSDFRLTNEGGGEVGKDSARVECVLSVGDSVGVLRGEIWIDKKAAGEMAGFGLTHFAVPLSERGRGHYREWALQGRQTDASKVDAEIAGFAAAPACPAS